MFNNKGQAASTDALFFLTIVSAIFTLIVGYSLTYGNDITSQADNLYKKIYHQTALKSFYIAAQGRDGNNFLDANISDSIATMLKEDYGLNNKIEDSTKYAVFEELDALFKPLSQRNYMLFISHDPTDNSAGVLVPLIVFIKTTDCDNSTSNSTNYYVCENNDLNPKAPFDMNAIETYLKSKTFDLQIVEGKFLLFKDIFSNIKKEDASIYLSSWLGQCDNSSFLENCKKFQFNQD